MTVQQSIKDMFQFNCNDVQFLDPTINKAGGKSVKVVSDKSTLHLSTHSMLTWGAQEFVDEASGKKSYNMSLQFEDDEKSQQALEKMKAFESKLKEDCVKNSKKWMNKASISPEVVDALFHPILNYPKDKNTGEPDYSRNPTMRVKLDCWDDKFTFEIYDVQGQPLFQPGVKEDIHPLELITKLSNVMTILRCGGLWFANGKFGCTWRLVQAVVKPRETLTGRCHIKISSEDIKKMESQKEAEEEEEEVKKDLTAIVDTDDEEEEDVAKDVAKDVAEEIQEAQPEPEPEPEPVKKKVVRKKKSAD